MPRYHCLDTEVQLSTWDPLSCQSTLDSSSPTTHTPARHSHSTSISDFRSQKNASAFNGRIPPYYHTRSQKVKRLTEEYFKGHEGLEFLGCDAPFFLIHAGTDPSDDTDSAEPLTRTNNSLYQDHKVSLKSSEGLTGTPFPRRSSTTANARPGIPYVDSTVNEGNQYPNDSNEVDLSPNGSSLSSLSSTAFLSPHASDLRSEESKVEIGGQTFRKPKPNTCKPQSNRASSFLRDT
jgi:hypothetical protein